MCWLSRHPKVRHPMFIKLFKKIFLTRDTVIKWPVRHFTTTELQTYWFFSSDVIATGKLTWQGPFNNEAFEGGRCSFIAYNAGANLLKWPGYPCFVDSAIHLCPAYGGRSLLALALARIYEMAERFHWLSLVLYSKSKNLPRQKKKEIISNDFFCQENVSLLNFPSLPCWQS